ncbi:MAG: murein biosynthesis integral membrane protein MurJ, partial [Planctomycetota bacterium]|nr:murein biosynthesis integral membrane protein MurJ [Planctomycetota bacterium]
GTTMAEDRVSSGATDRGFERHAFTVTLLTAASRVGGLVREACFSRLLGSGPVAGAFFFAFMVPNLFRRLFGEGALSAALIPEQTRLERRDPAAARRLVSSMLSWMAILLGGAVLVAEVVFALLPAESRTLGIELLRISFPYMPLICLAAIAGAVLQVRGRFGPLAAAPVLLNGVLVVAVVAAWWRGGGVEVGDSGIRLVAWAVVLAGVLQAGWTLIALRRSNPRVEGVDPVRSRRRMRLARRRVLLRSLPMMLGLGVLQVNTLLDGLIASWPNVVGDTILGRPYPLDDRAMADLTYAMRLYEFPLGVFGIAIATAIFPQLSREVGDRARFAATIRRGLRLGLFLGIPASVGVILVREPLTEVVLLGGAFDVADAGRVSTILLAYATAIWSYSTTHLLVRAFYARREPMTAVRVAMAIVALNFVLNVTLVFGTSLGVAGLAWSTAICSVVQTALLATLLSRRSGALIDRGVLDSVGRTLISTGVMAIVVGGVLAWVPFDRLAGTWLAALIALAAASGLGAAVHLGLARLGRRPELDWALGRDR